MGFHVTFMGDNWCWHNISFMLVMTNRLANPNKGA